MLKSYEPIWPETTILWGAGATASLGLPSTLTLGEIIWKLAQDDENIEDRFKKTNFFSKVYANDISDLLVALGDSLTSVLDVITNEELLASKRLFKDMDEKDLRNRIISHRQNYDWDALKRIIQISPTQEGKGSFLNDLFNIIDMHIQSGQALHVKKIGHSGRYLLQNYRLKPARNCLVMLINLLMFCAYHKMLEESPGKLKPYIEFAQALASLMEKEGLRFADVPHSFEKREFYLFSYAVISMNFDPVLLWLLFNAHKEQNNSNPPHLGEPCRPLKLFHDMGHFMGVRRIGEKDKTPAVWYPINEAVVQRLNDPEHTCGRIVRVGKFYFPHGCCCWRECPGCGKLTANFGDKWGNYSKSLFSSTLIPSMKKNTPRSKEESDDLKKGIPDAIQCAHCGVITEVEHIPMIMQSSFKGFHTSFIEEIQRDLKVCLEKTKHIVLMGYSLPQDDVIWRAILATRKLCDDNDKTYCSVVVGFKGEKRWLYDPEILDYVKRHKKEENNFEYGIPTIEAAQNIFGKERVRVFAGGIPEVWGTGSEVTHKVSEILYPPNIGIDCFTKDGVCRTGDNSSSTPDNNGQTDFSKINKKGLGK